MEGSRRWRCTIRALNERNEQTHTQGSIAAVTVCAPSFFHCISRTDRAELRDAELQRAANAGSLRDCKSSQQQPSSAAAATAMQECAIE